MQGESVISSLLKLVMKEFGLQQTGLAEAMGVSLDRVKSLTSGKVKNLKREESEALIKKLHIRGDWLATGEGPMFQSEGESQDTFVARQQAINRHAALVHAMPLDGHTRMQLTAVMTGDPLQDGPAIARALEKAPNPFAPDEVALVLSYRRCNVQAQANLIQTAALLAAGLPSGDAGSNRSSDKGPSVLRMGDMNNNAPGGVQVGYAGGKVTVKNVRKKAGD